MSRRAVDVAVVAVVALASAGMAGCVSRADPITTETSPTPTKTAASAVRYDTDSLAQRLPALPRPVVGEWVQGILGDEPAPGPGTIFWLDAIVELPAQQLSAFIDPYRSTMVLTPRPLLWKTLNTGVPTGAFDRSDKLDRALSVKGPQGGWDVKAYVPKDASVIVLTATGRDGT